MQGTIDAVVVASDAEKAQRVMASLPWRLLRTSILVAPASAAARTSALSVGATFVPSVGGYGANCLAALAKLQAVPVPPDIVVFIPADRIDDASGVAELTGALMDANTDVALAVPASGGTSPTWLLAKFVSGVYQRSVSSITGFCAIRYPALTALGMSAARNGWDVELIIRAMRLDLTIAEVPLPLARRDGNGGLLGAGIANAKTAAQGMYHVLRHLTIK